MPRRGAEPLDNIGFVCNEHAPKPQEKWANTDPKWFKGRFVKKAFEIKKEESRRGPTHEHMWVKVKGVEKGKLVGVLDNDPMFIYDLKCGQRVIVHLSEIEDVQPPNDA